MLGDEEVGGILEGVRLSLLKMNEEFFPRLMLERALGVEEGTDNVFSTFPFLSQRLWVSTGFVNHSPTQVQKLRHIRVTM